MDASSNQRARSKAWARKSRVHEAWRRWSLRVGLVFAWAMPAAALAQSSFQWLVDSPTYNNSAAYRLSDDGSTLIGTSSNFGGPPGVRFLWRTDTGFVAFQTGTDLSGDGSVVVGGTAGPSGLAYRWTQPTGYVSLGDLPGGTSNSIATVVTSDGSTVFGQAHSASGVTTFRWTEATGLEDLMLPSSPTLGTPDGSVLVGFDTNQYFRWTQAGGYQVLGMTPEGSSGSFRDLTEDGNRLVGGELSLDSQSWIATKWTPANGVEDFDNNGVALAVAPDGSLMGGWYGPPGAELAAIWHADGTFEPALDFLQSHIECLGYEDLWWVTDIAINGNIVTMVGDGGRPGGGTRAWIATYPLTPPPPPPEIACRAGNINASVGPVTDVLFVNNSAGSCPDRIVNVTPATPLTVRIARPPSNGSRYAMYLWPRLPSAADVRSLPQGLGMSCMPMPTNPGSPQPLKRANNIGHNGLLGTENWPGPTTQPAPYTLLNLAGGLGRTGNFFFQGIMVDANAPNGRAGVTNAILVVSQ
ncbi:MAG: hypothetical protein HYR85_08310 [Planctomycetes bacterium]|nr:hypothetical protein [Planctomycetota bacterium]